MPDDDTTPDVPNDGTILIPVPDERTTTMAADLPEAVSHALLTETVGNIQMSNTNARNSSQEVNSVLARSSARKFDELGPVESRATSGVIATPVASPTTQ